MIYCFDIDGTICDTVGSRYEESVPRPGVIAVINALYKAGHTIKIWTARGATSGKDLREFTEVQLAAWHVRYHELVMGKPDTHVFVDDKAVNFHSWWLTAMSGGSS